MSVRPEVLALIPARGGSKSVPRKNLRMLAGKPLIAHAIEDAARSRRITRVVVSTDDEEIAAAARAAGADVPFMRPVALAADDTPDLPVFQHALTALRESEGYGPAAVVHLRATYPIRRPETIDAAIDLLLSRDDIDSVRSVSVAHQTPYKMWRIGGDGCLTPVVYLDDGRAGHALPRQALPRVFWQNGYVDVTRPGVILEQGSMGGRRILPFIIEEAGLEIDYAEDLEAAERFLAADAPARTLTRDRMPS